MKKKLRRSEAFLGIHFDFHADEESTNVGESVSEEMIENIILKVNPDYIQCDCKGHPGLSSYPTKVGYQAPRFVKDPLKVWRDVTQKHSVALFMHYSGVVDVKAITEHPDWARVDEKGENDKRSTSVFGPYVDKLLIPQLKELIDVYKVDGIWVDGDCWGAATEYSENVLEEFRKQTGIDSIPRSPEDPYFFEFCEFCREGYRNYVRHYVDEIHKYAPDFQIASNWAYSYRMPEAVDIDVDFLSGDYEAMNAFNSARFGTRIIAGQGKPWDLMAWGFAETKDTVRNIKSVPQLKQEAAAVLATGGGFQAYFIQKKKTGAIYNWNMDVMAEVAKFCRARQAVCHKAVPVPQIAVMYSIYDFYKRSELLFSPTRDIFYSVTGVMNSLLDTQNSVELRTEDNISDQINDYPMIVLPEIEFVDPNFKNKLLKYVKNGGNLLLIGPSSAKHFKDELDIEFVGEPTLQSQWLKQNGRFDGLKSIIQTVIPGPKAEVLDYFYSDYDDDAENIPAATVSLHGKGKIIAIYANFGKIYHIARSCFMNKWLNSIVKKHFSNPIVELSGSSSVEVAVNKINGKLAINLINIAGPHADNNVLVFDDIPPVGPLSITIRTEKKPHKVTLEPGSKDIDYQYENGKIHLQLKHLDIHNVILVEN